MIAGTRVDRSRLFRRAQERTLQTGVSGITPESTATGAREWSPRACQSPSVCSAGRVRTTTGGLLVAYEAGDMIWYRPFGGGLRRVIVDKRGAEHLLSPGASHDAPALEPETEQLHLAV
jgi:hypothetical protein